MTAEHRRLAPGGLLFVMLVVAAAGLAGGAYAWWKWGILVALDTMAKFSL